MKTALFIEKLTIIADRYRLTADQLKKTRDIKNYELLFFDISNNELVLKSEKDLIAFLKAEIRDLDLYIKEFENEQE